MSELHVEEEDVRKVQQDLSEWLRIMRESISKCEDVSGDDGTILQNYETCKKLESSIRSYKEKFEKLDLKVIETKQNHPNLDTSFMEKENSNLLNRYDKVSSTAAKILNLLSTALERRYQVALQDFQRWMLTNKEKLSSCKPDLAGDRYSLEANLGLLQEVETNLPQGENKKMKLDVTAGSVLQVLSPELHPEIQTVIDQTNAEWSALVSSLNTIKSTLLNNLHLWQKYENEFEVFNSWLKSMESKVKSMTAQQIELNGIEQQLSVIVDIQNEVSLKKTCLEDLLQVIQSICFENPEVRLKTQATQITSRYTALERTLQESIRRLEGLLKVKKEYEIHKEKLRDCLNEMNAQLNNFDTSGDKETLQTKNESLKELLSKKEQNTPKLSAVTDAGELIYLSLSLEGRDQIRKEMRCLRDSWDENWDKVNAAIKDTNTSLMAWGTFEESCKQVEVWLKELSSQLKCDMPLKPSLGEKKLQLQSCKAVAQSILAYEAIISKLKDKAASLPESTPKQNVANFQAQYDDLIISAKEHVQICDKYVSEHEGYSSKLEQFQDWLTSLKAAVDMSMDQSDTEALKVKMIALSTVLASLEEGEIKLAELNGMLKTVLEHTDEKGHSALKFELNNIKEEWLSFLRQCQSTQEDLSEAVHGRDVCEFNISKLEAWITAKDHLLREQGLRSNLDAKQSQLQNVKTLESEILGKQAEISALNANVDHLSGDVLLMSRISKVLNKYQMLKNSAKDSVRKWELYVKEHETFEAKLAEVLKWLEEPEKKLQENSILFGEASVLQERKAYLETLSDQLSQNLYHVESTIELGEKLYSSTSPEGREIIRQKLKNLQKHWEALQERSSGSLRAIESCLQKLISFSQGQERLSKWLQEVGLSVQQHTELKATLQEKRAQLQSQKIIHQDIISHSPLLESVCEKANELMAVTGDNTIPSYIQDVKMMYNAMCSKSEGLLQNLKENISDHQKHLDDSRKFQEFLSTCNFKLLESKDTTGEKAAIIARLSILKELMTKQAEGNKLISDLEKLSIEVCKHTSDHGCEIIQHELKELSESWGQYNTSLKESKCNLENIILQWSSFDKNMDFLNKLLKEIDAEIRKPHLQSTLEEKEVQFVIIKDLSEKVTACQKDLDILTDEAHSLTHSSAVESIKFEVSQLSVKYQNLVSLSKTLLQRWGSIVQDHRAFEQKSIQFSNWLEANQKMLTDIEKEDSLEQSMIKLQVLVNDKFQGQQLLGETVQSGEQLYQDTSAPGREVIREHLRELRDRFDFFSNTVIDKQRKLDSLNQNWVNFKDTFKQILNWIDTTEKIISSYDLNLPALQDVSPRLMKYKALSQEAENHKKHLDLLQSKVQSIAPLMKEEDLSLSVEEAIARFNKVASDIKKCLEKTELLSNQYRQCQDQRESCEDWCQKSEEHLALCSDFAGNRSALKAKEENLKDLKEHVPEGLSKIETYRKVVEKLPQCIAARDHDQLLKSYAAFEKRCQHISTSLDNILRELSEKFKQWEVFDEKCNTMSNWLEMMEMRIKDFSLKTTVEEKIEQRDKFQTLLDELRIKEADFDVLSDESQELIATSGEMRISMGTSQLMSRFQSMLLTCKELARKCEQHVDEHLQFNEKYKLCSDWVEAAASQYANINILPYNSCETLQKKLNLVQGLLQTKDEGLNMVNATVQYGEQLQVGTSSDGWDTIQLLLQNLQIAFDQVFDDASSLDRSLSSTQFVWSEFEESLQRLQSWITTCSANFKDTLKLGKNLDDKNALLRTFKALLVNIKGHEGAVEDLQVSRDCVPTLDTSIDETISTLAEKQKNLKSKAEEYISFYENSVHEHSAWNKTVIDLKNWLNSTQVSIDACKDTNLDRISLLSSLKTIQNILPSFSAERPKLQNVEETFKNILNSTHEEEKDNLLGELKSLQLLFESTDSSAKLTADFLEDLMNQWKDYEERVSEVQAWMKEMESSLQTISLRESLSEKRLQLDKLKNIQGEIREKELEIDALTDKMQQLQKGPSKRRISRLSELGIYYQLLVSKARDTYVKWNQYVMDHQEFLNLVSEFQKHLSDLKQKLDKCQNPEGTIEDVEEKLNAVRVKID